jgi:hypothetical protein
MKTTLFLFSAAVMLHAGGVAQPTINIGGVTPVIGSSVTWADGSYADPGFSGANQTWDLSSMTPEIVTTSNFILPFGLPQSGSFPGATHVANAPVEGGAQLYAYSAIANNEMRDLGYYSIGPFLDLSVIYTNPRTVAVFPLSYNNTFSDTFQSELVNQLDGGVISATDIGSLDAQVDGYGTLTTPAGTYTDVLRVRYEIVSTTVLSINGVIMSTSENSGVEYQFFKSGIPIPLARVTTNVLTSMGEVIDVSQTGGYYMSMGVGIDEKESLFGSVHMFPMPASTHIELVLNSNSQTNLSFVLLSTTGQAVYQWNQQAINTGQNQLRLDLPELAAGSYLLQITSLKGKHTQRLVIGK